MGAGSVHDSTWSLRLATQYAHYMTRGRRREMTCRGNPYLAAKFRSPRAAATRGSQCGEAAMCAFILEASGHQPACCLLRSHRITEAKAQSAPFSLGKPVRMRVRVAAGRTPGISMLHPSCFPPVVSGGKGAGISQPWIATTCRQVRCTQYR